MKEAHCSPYTTHPSSARIYQDLGIVLVGCDKKRYHWLCAKVFSMLIG